MGGVFRVDQVCGVGVEHCVRDGAHPEPFEGVLAHPDTRRLLDLTRPVGLLLVSILHFIPDADNPARIVAGYRAALTGGGYLAISHFSINHNDQARLGAIHNDKTPTPVIEPWPASPSRGGMPRYVRGQLFVAGV